MKEKLGKAVGVGPGPSEAPSLRKGAGCIFRGARGRQSGRRYRRVGEVAGGEGAFLVTSASPRKCVIRSPSEPRPCGEREGRRARSPSQGVGTGLHQPRGAGLRCRLGCPFDILAKNGVSTAA